MRLCWLAVRTALLAEAHHCNKDWNRINKNNLFNRSTCNYLYLNQCSAVFQRTNIDEAAVVLQALSGTAGLLLRLLHLGDLRGLTAHLTGTSEGAVDLSCRRSMKICKRLISCLKIFALISLLSLRILHHI